MERKKVIQIDKYYPSRQICNVCDYRNKEVKDLRVRKCSALDVIECMIGI